MPKKVFLIRLARPSLDLSVVPPLGIMYLASALRTWGGHRVALYDMKLEGNSIEKATKRATEFSPDVVGLSLMSYEAPVMSALAASLKKALPNTLVIAGGPHPSSCPQDVISDPNIDMCVLGEGETTLSKILERLEEGGDLDEIEGTALNVDGQFKINPSTTFIKDLDLLPMPAWDLVPVEGYFSKPRFGVIYRNKNFWLFRKLQ
jgi:radical SAM superfamily enzyme YgiQ (UPF0313 family)